MSGAAQIVAPIGAATVAVPAIAAPADLARMIVLAERIGDRRTLRVPIEQQLAGFASTALQLRQLLEFVLAGDVEAIAIARRVVEMTPPRVVAEIA